MLPAARDEALMRLALDEAASATTTADVPVGAIVVDASGAVIGTGRNERELRHDPTAHAEVVALREAAARLGSWRLDGCALVVTLEPCVMCAGAILASRVARVLREVWWRSCSKRGWLNSGSTPANSNTRRSVSSRS